MRRLTLLGVSCVVFCSPAFGGQTAPPLPAGTRKVFSIEQALQPEPVVFIHMRLLASARNPARALSLRNTIRQWRIFAHDRKRNLGVNKWVAPKEIVRRRRVFEQLLQDAKKLADKARRSPGRTARDRAQRRRAIRALGAKLKQAARIWPDPLLRDFLVGAAAQTGEDYRLAELTFRKCRKAAPRVAAFHQAHGLALLEVKRPLDALEAFTEALRLRPDSATALRLLRQAGRQVPGAQTSRPAYVAAKKLLEQYDESPARRRTSTSGGMEWLMPGKALRTRSFKMPVPRYDRLVFRQAVAVPVGTSALLVDAGVLKGALEIHVRIDDKTLAVGRIRRVSTYRRRRKDKAAPPLALVRVEDFEFTAVKADPAATFAGGQKVLAFGLGVFEEMGRGVRRISTKLKADKGGGLLPANGLAAGESASPVLTDDGRLVGFLTARTDVTADNGGQDRLIGVADLKDILKRAASKSRGSRPSTYRRVKRTVTPKPAVGNAFVIYAIAGEKAEE